MPRNARLALPALALTTLAAAGVVGAATSPATRPHPVVVADTSNTALPALSFPAGVYMSNRVSDHVSLPAGTVLVFQGLPPGLSYDPSTTAIEGVPTTPGVYTTSATAYIAGIPVRTETTTVTITGDAVAAPAPAPAAPAPAPADGGAAPAPAAPAGPTGPIDLDAVAGLNLPDPFGGWVYNTAVQINAGVSAMWNAMGSAH